MLLGHAPVVMVYYKVHTFKFKLPTSYSIKMQLYLSCKFTIVFK